MLSVYYEPGTVNDMRDIAVRRFSRQHEIGNRMLDAYTMVDFDTRGYVVVRAINSDGTTYREQEYSYVELLAGEVM